MDGDDDLVNKNWPPMIILLPFYFHVKMPSKLFTCYFPFTSKKIEMIEWAKYDVQTLRGKKREHIVSKSFAF